jgi:hypothetical protein
MMRMGAIRTMAVAAALLALGACSKQNQAADSSATAGTTGGANTPAGAAGGMAAGSTATGGVTGGAMTDSGAMRSDSMARAGGASTSTHGTGTTSVHKGKGTGTTRRP